MRPSPAFIAAALIAALMLAPPGAPHAQNNPAESDKTRGDRKSTFEDGSRHTSAGAPFLVTGGAPEHCRYLCVAELRCTYWVQAAGACMLYDAEPVALERAEFYRTGKITR